MKRMKLPRGLRILLYIHLGLLAGALGLYFFNILIKELGISELFGCTVARYAHLYCPGCGGTRAVSAMLRLDLWDALLYNANLPVWTLTLLYIDIRTIILTVKNGAAQRYPYFSRPLFINLMVVAVAVFLIRNLLLVFWGIDFLGGQSAFWQEHALFL